MANLKWMKKLLRPQLRSPSLILNPRFCQGSIVLNCQSSWQASYLDSTTINKTKPICVLVKVQVDLLSEFSKFVEMGIINPIPNESRIEKIKIQYGMVPKYCKECKLKRHDEKECRVLHLELMKKILQEEDNAQQEKVEKYGLLNA